MRRKELEQLAQLIHREEGDAIEGERVVAQARKIGAIRTVPGTSTHKMQEITLRKNVLCVLDRPHRLVRGATPPFRLKG